MSESQSQTTIRVWDPIVRIGHWVLVAAFATAFLTEGEPEWLHTTAGYAIAVTVALRLAWGFVGPEHARFSGFVTGPAAVWTYLRGLPSGRSKRHLGHSPAGGAMTVALLIMLGVTAVSGMGTLAAEEGRGPLAGIVASSSAHDQGVYHDDDDHDEAGELWEEVHEVAANLSLVLVFLHLGGVAIASYAHRENLVRAMITGRKPVR